MARRIVLRSDDTPSRPSEADLTLDYREALNAQQHAVVTADPGAVLVVAGAGTGKTRTLIYRMAYLVETGTRPNRIVLLTFTRRAAREMRARATHLLDGRCQKVRGGTFHAFCLQILRQHAEGIGLPRNFTVLDSTDAADVVSVVRTRGRYGQGEERFPQKGTLQSMFSAVTNRAVPLQDILAERYPQYAGLHDELQALRGAYMQYKRDHGLLDFDDLLLRTLELFDTDDAVRRQVAQRCKHVLVDEYQDTNPLQAALVQQFASVHGNVMVVGDDAQSIYRFRGADVQNIFDFPDQFPDTTLLRLEQNYRSTQPILDLANHVIEHADASYDKTLFSDEKEGLPPALVPAPDGETESRFVAQMILQLREEGVDLNRMAVLFRSGHNAYDLEIELNQRNIPFVKYGGLKLNEAAHIKDVIAHLKVAENPDDAAAWHRVLRLLHGIGPKTARDLIDWITDAADDPFELSHSTPFSKRYIEGLKKLFSMLRSIRAPDASVADQVEAILTYYQPLFEKKYADDFPKREADLDHLVGIAEGYDDRQRFLSSMALDPIELTALDQDGVAEDEPPLVLSTIHSAKGLEFHTVFLIRALEGTLPSRYALRESGGIDEELRLFYVAITRAEENLYISYPTVQYQRSGNYFASPSRFVEDIPDDVLEPVQLVEASDAASPPSLSDGGSAPGSGSLPSSDASPPALSEDASGDAPSSAPPSSRSGPEADSPNDGLPF
jgi:DNA helicase-2/ATP-dependent DNA helicase PcrA